MRRRGSSVAQWLTKLAWLACAACTDGSARAPSAVQPPARDVTERQVTQPAPPAPTPGASVVTLSIVATNDVHGHLEQLPLLGGYLKNLRAVRARDGGAVLLLDAGDIFQGTLESNLGEGAAMIHAYAALGVTAAAVGNHEFDFGPVGPHAVPLAPGDDPLGALRARVQQAPFPFLSANLAARDPESPKPPIAEVKKSLQLTAAGVRIGVVGGLTREALSQTHADNVRQLRLLPLAAAIAQAAAELRAGGAQLVIAVVHAGGDCRDVSAPDDLSSCEQGAEAFALARDLPAGVVDVIVAGHTHAGVAHRVNGVAIVESYANARAFGRVDLRFDRARGQLLETKIHPPEGLCAEALEHESCALAKHSQYEGAAVTRDPAVLAAIADDVAQAKSLRETSLGVQVTHAVERASTAESALSNLIADSMLAAFPDAQVAINNAGSVRADLPAGPLTYGRVFEVFPFDNVLATLSVRGDELAAIVRDSLRSDRGLLAVSGVRAQARCEGEKLRVSLTKPDGTAIADDARLTLVTSDYLATRGDGVLHGIDLAQRGLVLHRDRVMRDALVSYLRAVKDAKLDGRDPALGGPQNPRIRYPGRRPLRCARATGGGAAP